MSRDAELSAREAGEGRPCLVLHGGGGPVTVAPLSRGLAASMRTITPTHPGWNGSERPDSVRTIADVAALYATHLERAELRDVVLVGSSLGGWIAAELALRDRGRRVSALVLIDAVGIAVEGEPVTDFFALDPRGVAEKTFHDSERFYVDPADLSEEQRAAGARNMKTMRALAGDPYMHDPGLRERLGELDLPTLVLWGEADGITSPAYGRALAAAIPGARFELVAEAGHVPQLEQTEATLASIERFLARARS